MFQLDNKKLEDLSKGKDRSPVVQVTVSYNFVLNICLIGLGDENIDFPSNAPNIDFVCDLLKVT